MGTNYYFYANKCEHCGRRAQGTLCAAGILFSASRKLTLGWYVEASRRSDEFLKRINEPPA